MKITELIADLQALRAKYGDMDVKCASDAEGNRYGALAEVAEQHYLGDDYHLVAPCDRECGVCEECQDCKDVPLVAMLWPL